MGRKRVKLDSESHPNKCAKRYEGDDDRISGLVDDIIVVILSFLPLKEAARTSVLSSRWVNLWKYTSCLNFDAESALQRIADAEGEGYKIASRMEIHNYRKWVNHVLKSHKAPTLREFRICFDWRVWCRQKTIIKWLKFALARQVQRLELDLKHNNYVFPEELLTSIGFKSLTSLTLKYVNVSGEAIEFFLRNCPLLEKLAVNGTNKILNLEVCGSSLALKHLDLCSCMYLKTIKISAPNLLSLKITILDGLGLQLDYVPMLVEVYVDNNACRYYYLGHLLPALTCCISQLEILDLSLFPHEENNVELYKFPELLKLKKLSIRYWSKGYESLLGFTSLIRASPYLEEFVFKLTWIENHRQLRWSWADWVERSNIKVKNGKSFRHQHLKVFKFHGYYDAELVRHIVENCAVLQKIIIDPSNEFGRLMAEETVKKYAKQQLEGQLPQHIEFVIL